MGLKYLKIDKKKITVVIVVILLFFLHFINILDPIENMVVKFLNPVQTKIYSLGQIIYSKISNISNSKKLALENEELKKQLIEKNYNLAVIKELEQENSTLKKLLNFISEKEFRTVTGNVIGKSDSAEFNTVVINIGAKDGAKEGEAVISEEGVLVGKIYEVLDDYSTVLLITDNHSKVAASVLNQNKTIGVLEGKYGLSSEVNLIPQNEIIAEGDLIVTSGLEQLIPAGVLIGEVDRVTDDAGDLFKTVSVKILVDLNKIKVVSVLVQ